MSSFNIEAAVDAGARAWFDNRQAQRRDATRLNPKTGERWQWEDVHLDDQKSYRAFVRPIVVAALAVAAADKPEGGGT